MDSLTLLVACTFLPLEGGAFSALDGGGLCVGLAEGGRFTFCRQRYRSPKVIKKKNIVPCEKNQTLQTRTQRLKKKGTENKCSGECEWRKTGRKTKELC